MNFVKISCCLIVLASSCMTPMPTQNNNANTVVVGMYNISMPNMSITYSYNQITSTIQNIQIAKQLINKDLDSLKTVEDSIKSVPPVGVKKESDKKQKQIEICKNNLQQKLQRLNRLDEAWGEIGFYNLESRLKKDNLDTLFAKTKYADFLSFIGLKQGDFVGRAIDIFGTPTKQSVNSIEYDVGNTQVLKIEFSQFSGKIQQIELTGGKYGIHFIENNKRAYEFKCKLLGIPRYKIQQYLGNATYNGNYYSGNDYNGFIEYYDIQKTDTIGIKLAFYFNKDNICERMSIKFTTVN